MKLFLDDERTAPPGPEWVTVRNASDAIFLLGNIYFEEVSLDHDLGNDGVGTGYDVICALEILAQQEPFFVPPIIKIHTANPSARVKMELALQSINRIIGR